MTTRWPVEEVEALAGDARGLSAARLAAVPAKWSAVGCDLEATWGLFIGAAGEPYQTAVEFSDVTARCTCPSRKYPCKHALALLLLWAGGHVPEGPGRPGFVAAWMARRAAQAGEAASAAKPAREADADPPGTPPRRPRAAGVADDVPPAEASPPDPARDKRAAERMARMIGGLVEFERWTGDCLRGGLTAPSLASYRTWDVVAARLVDAQAPSMANRVRRVGSLVGVGAMWHERVLGELAVMQLLSAAGRRLAHLDGDLADSVRAALGWTVRQADVLAVAPEAGEWEVLGRSDMLEDRIVVRRTWLRMVSCPTQWALVLSFAAYGQSLSDTPQPGDRVHADVHRYPGRRELRSLIGQIASHDVASNPGLSKAVASHAVASNAVASNAAPVTTSLAGACDEVGGALAAVPWLERWPICVFAAPTLVGGRWWLGDHTGSLPLSGVAAPVTLLAATSGRAAPIVCEWTADGLVPLSIHADGRLIDIGPRGGFHERRWDRAS